MSCAQGDHLELMSKRLKTVEKENSDLRQRVQKQEKDLANQARQVSVLKKALTANDTTHLILKQQPAVSCENCL